METKEKLNGKAVNTNKGDKRTQFVHGNPVNKENTKPQETEKPNAGKETEQPKQEAGKQQTEAPKTEQQTTQANNEQPKAEPKAEPKTEAAKPALNLEGTLKLVEELHRRKVQRDKLINTITNLESFEIAVKEEADETAGNNFQRCELTIEDDKGNEFVTKNPVIIQAVAQYVNYLCVNRLAEVEVYGIVITA